MSAFGDYPVFQGGILDARISGGTLMPVSRGIR
jgi:hypothetical protein